MASTGANSAEKLNGLRTLELATALRWLTDEFAKRLGHSSRTFSTKGVRSLNEQEIIGISQILLVMYPFAIELALKSLWTHLHPMGSYKHIHDLATLFHSLPEGAEDKSDAKKVQNEARQNWSQLQSTGIVSTDSGDLDDFLLGHANDFSDIRYYKYRTGQQARINDLKACLFCIIAPLAARDPETFDNFVQLGGQPMPLTVPLDPSHP